ncbi:MAG: type VII toxin-antitoxin system HepT family RNase toxin [Rhodanobacter sp.]
MDRLIVARKLDSLRRCLNRVRERCPADVATLAGDADLQDIVVLNLSRAVQICVDLALHTLSSLGQPVPDTMGQAFDQLADAGRLPADLALRLKKAVGFRNIAVHNYSAIDWAIVHAIATRHLDDFEAFARHLDPPRA